MAPNWLIWLALPIGLAIVVLNFTSVILVLVLPRATSPASDRWLNRGVYWLFVGIAHLWRSYEGVDGVMALAGPALLIIRLFYWMLVFFLGYSLINWPLLGSLGGSLLETGSSLLTLGFVHSPAVASTVVDFMAGLTGPVVIALQISYLPTIYGSFNRREIEVTMLEARAGSPAWGPEILARAHLSDLTDGLAGLYADWERWAAEVMESHSNYTTLIFLRSPSRWRSWVVALIAVLDAAALHLAVTPATAPYQARLCLRMGFTCLREICQILDLPYERDPHPDLSPLSLSYEEFAAAVAMLDKVGFPLERTAEEAWPDFRGWRVNYELAAYSLADLVLAPHAPWTGGRSHIHLPEVYPTRPVHRLPGGRIITEIPRRRS